MGREKETVEFRAVTVKAETEIYYLGSLNDEWAYVMVQTEDGQWMCGFMPHYDISNG